MDLYNRRRGTDAQADDAGYETSERRRKYADRHPYARTDILKGQFPEIRPNRTDCKGQGTWRNLYYRP